ncbi:hypothetical protein [Streptomyces kronopolitis]|uniref:hypothetical protein n=1 Tax=Streptomyces kronopolitis TaxID=1612435 RepID=UPI0020C04582|nr:hypothetical protein [Streptomyces kronopolitis]MCL6297126.1 hypothetical protein [Streptomyces kronopolitis]
MPEEMTPHLIGQETVEGNADAWGEFDGRQFRDGALRLVTRSADRAVVRAVGPSAEAPLFSGGDLSVPLADLGEFPYVTPVRGGVAVSRHDSVSYHSRDGAAAWSFRHFPWGDGPLGSGACAETPDGRHLLAVVPGTPDAAGQYPGDRCVLLASDTGELLDETLLPTFSASYSLDSPLRGAPAFFLSGEQGQDGAYSWRVDVADGRLHLMELTSGTARVTGARHDSVVVQDVGGTWLRVRRALPDGSLRTECEVDPELLRGAQESYLMGDSGFVDDSHVIAAVGEECWSEETEHFLFDLTDPTVRRRVRYPVPVGMDAKALGDGTWLTSDGDDVHRWRLAP